MVDFVLREWQPTFDAMATPISALCGAYATLEDDVLRPDAVPAGSVVFVNPAYAPTDALNGAGGIEVFLSKLIETDVRRRGCTLIALLPNVTAPWHERYVGASHEVHHVVGQLVFQNPCRNLRPEKQGYLLQRSYILSVWRPGPAPTQPAWRYAHLGAALPHLDRIRLRCCRLCGRVRVWPRWAETQAEPSSFECQDNPDRAYASCTSRNLCHYIYHNSLMFHRGILFLPTLPGRLAHPKARIYTFPDYSRRSHAGRKSGSLPKARHGI